MSICKCDLCPACMFRHADEDTCYTPSGFDGEDDDECRTHPAWMREEQTDGDS